MLIKAVHVFCAKYTVMTTCVCVREIFVCKCVRCGCGCGCGCVWHMFVSPNPGSANLLFVTMEMTERSKDLAVTDIVLTYKEWLRNQLLNFPGTLSFSIQLVLCSMTTLHLSLSTGPA